MKLFEARESLRQYIEKENYEGYDPYDALGSPLFDLPFFRNNKLMRFGAQQVVKRSPLNLRPLLFVPKGRNPVTLGLCIQGYAYLIKKKPEKEKQFLDKIIRLSSDLEKLVPKGFSGACWGYDFDWEARNARIPAYQPTVVATGIIINGLFEAWKVTGAEKLKELIISSANFVLKDLNRTFEKDTFCFSYSPFDHQQVFNASMKGVRLLSQVYHITKRPSLLDEATKAVQFVANRQRENGSWGYSLAPGGGWTDNYHTGYVLDCLQEYVVISGENTYHETLEKGYAFYKNNFFTEKSAPKFMDNKTFPVDCTAGAQSILTLTRFGDRKLADKVATYMVEAMQNSNGYFYFRKYNLYTEKTSFMRWSNAWMFTALSYLTQEK